MNATSLTDSAEPEPPKKSFWKKQVPRWGNWYLLWASLTALICVSAALWVIATDNRSLAAFFFGCFITATYLLALAAFVKSCVKEE